MRTLDKDAYEMIARVIDPSGPATLVDVGANTGQSSRRMAEVFPKATIHAFEPAPDAFAQLSSLAQSMPRLRPWAMAVGEKSGTVDLNIMGDSEMNSVLAPSSLGRMYYPGDILPRRAVNVPMISLDQWAAENQIGPVHLLKIDVQGLELDVLKGAQHFIRAHDVRAIKCEAQLVQEYEGAATFFDLVPFMKSLRMELHQIHEIWERGPERQHSCVDALWVRADLIDALREEPDCAYRVDWRRRMKHALASCEASGARRIAIYGAGGHTRACERVFRGNANIVAIIDDDTARAGQRIGDVPIMTAAQAKAAGVDAIVLSSNSAEPILWNAAATFRDAGIPVHRLYPEYPELHEPAKKSPAANVISPVGVAAEPASAALPFHASPKTSTPEEAFRASTYLRLNARRLEHLSTLGLDLKRKRVLEVGAGIGDLTGFFLDRDCQVHATDARPDNIRVLRSVFSGDARVTTGQLDLDHPQPVPEKRFDVVFCYGLLYHLLNPAQAIATMSDACSGLLLLETCVSFGEQQEINAVREDQAVHSQAYSGVGCRPTRTWLHAQLRKHFAHVYVPRTQPAHPQFPLDWTASRGQDPLTRAVFVASRTPIDSSMLTSELISMQLAA